MGGASAVRPPHARRGGDQHPGHGQQRLLGERGTGAGERSGADQDRRRPATCPLRR
ncbi:hypothetical protein [Microbispora sp. CSR-4]|uniref:hypothetical protein n=1 Tax=Microbispora sp. CSR-4 TaxID=2592813 RepID=UPI00164F90F0|nr:hypothetical protein [Microbispora sp. CSR-4]